MTPAQSRTKVQLCAALAGILRHRHVAIPEAGFPVWEAFLMLSQTRRHHAGGPEPISLLEIEAYMRLYGPLHRHHVDMLLAMDMTWLQWAANPKAAKPPAVPLTSAMFDFAFG